MDQFARPSAISVLQHQLRLLLSAESYFHEANVDGGDRGGGAPANKYYENGGFATAETMFCRYIVKLPLDIVLDDLEATLMSSPQAAPGNS